VNGEPRAANVAIISTRALFSVNQSTIEKVSGSFVRLIFNPFPRNTVFNSFLTRAIVVKFELSDYTGSPTKHGKIKIKYTIWYFIRCNSSINIHPIRCFERSTSVTKEATTILVTKKLLLLRILA
jgi:hypothetical protein